MLFEAVTQSAGPDRGWRQGLIATLMTESRLFPKRS